MSSPVKVAPKGFHKDQIKIHIILILVSIIMGLPIIYIVNHAFKPFTELFAYPPKFFVNRPTIENFRLLMNFSNESGIPLSRYIFNSILVASVLIILTLLISTAASFALSKLQFTGKETFNKINTIALMFVPIAVAIPRFLIIVNLGLYNSIWAHVVPMLAMPIGLFLLKQFIDQIPDSLIEAARMDGANYARIYWSIILPNIKAPMITVSLLTFQSIWGNLEASSIFMDKESIRTLPFYMSTLSSQTGNMVASAGVEAVGSLLMFLPNLILFIILQNKVMNSMAHTGIK